MIEDARIFLLDLNPSRGLGKELQGILESFFNVDIQLEEILAGTSVASCCSHDHLSVISHFNPDVIFLILSPGQLKHLRAMIQSLIKEQSELPIMIVTEGGKSEEMIKVLKLGISDFITPPLKAIDIIPRLWRLLERKHRGNALIHSLKEKLGLKQLIGKSPNFLAEIEKIPIVAKCDAGVVISGETGTGKELCARAIHYLSLRANKPFIPVNCGAIPTDLVENELFGHVQGAFTGASKSFSGLIQEADGGTLFLDEISCLPLQAQVKLLRFLQDKVYRHLGSTKMHQADVRVIVATNIELEEAIREGKFRQDLYYRLNIIPLTLPPLRERKEDIPLLARHFLDKYALELNKQTNDITSEAMQKLIIYDWPGNVRELENVIERAVIFSKETLLQDIDIVLKKFETPAYQESFQKAKSRIIEQFEESYIRGLLFAFDGNITRAANAAQKNRRAFYELIRKYKIEMQDFKPIHVR